jgi:hypothetical protein
MSARLRAKPWFSKAPTLRDLERAAQIHYGWDDWNEPLTSLLQKAESHFLSELERFFWNLEDASAEARRIRISPFPWPYFADMERLMAAGEGLVAGIEAEPDPELVATIAGLAGPYLDGAELQEVMEEIFKGEKS